MGPAVFGISLLVFLVAIIMLIIFLFKRKSLKSVKHLFLTGVALFIFSLFLPGPSEESTSPDKDSEKENIEQKEETDEVERTSDKEQDEKNRTEDSNEETSGKQSSKEQTDDESTAEEQTSSDDNKDKSQADEQGSNSDSKQEKTDTQKSNPSTSGLEAARVSRVVDGDTIEIQYKGKTEDVRLLLVDTPETVHPSKPVQPFGPEASAFAKENLSGRQVKVEFDGPKRDHYDRLLAYIWVDGKMFNQVLLEEGLTRLAYVYDPPYTHYDAYVKAQTQAVNAKKGIWSIDGYVTEDGFNDSASSENSGQSSGHSESGGSGNTGSGEVIYDPNGPDRDCGDFDTHKQAQSFFEAAGGPDNDPHRLDRDGNDLACESLS
ncbi:micrococcal nuclease [Salinibacillus kushneri]|uniref:Micrococcal nuclease n=1 Tax=Salinibacillus kushneri TaxID=237682 RepID=A0A1I0ETK5_9BACI|nr:thermonuclease family protein [Salinibacillus kushneri]SET47932.1 micrococcal nuclease [Salinibacillus kushneri]